MGLLDDVMGQIAAAIGPRGVDANAPGAMPTLRPRSRGPVNPVMGSSSGYQGNSRVGQGDDGMFMGAAVPPQQSVTPDDRYAHQRRAAEYPDAHDATAHLRDVNGPGAIAGTVKTDGGGGTAVSSPYGAPPPTPGNEATGGGASLAPAAPVAPPVTPATQTAGSLLRAPQYQPPDMAKRQGLERERTAAMTPTDPNAPGIKPGIGRKIGAALLGIGAGFGRNGGDPGAARSVASQVLGSKFNAAERARTAKFSQANQQISDFDTEANEERKNFEESIKGANAATDAARENREAQGDANVPEGQRVVGPNGKEGYYTRSGKFVEGAPTAAAQKDDAGEKLDEQFDSRTREANKLGLRGAARTRFIAEGKTESGRTPGQGENEYRDWHAQYKREHDGKEPPAKAIQDYKAGVDPESGQNVKPPQEKRGTPAQFAATEKQKAKALAEAEKDFQGDLTSINGIKDPKARAAREQEAKDALQKAKDAAQDGYEQQITSLGGSVSGNGQQAQAGGNAPAAPSGASSEVYVKGKLVGHVVNKKYIPLPGQ